MDDFTPVALAKRELLIRAVSDARRIGLQFGKAVDEVGKRIKSEGAVWFAPRRLWVFRHEDPQRLAGRLQRSFGDLRSGFELGTLEHDLRSRVASEADYFTQLLDVQVFPLKRTPGFAVSFEYDVVMVDAMRALKGRFHKFARAWEVQASKEQVLQVLRETAGVALEFVFVHEQAVILEELAAAAASEAPISVPAAAPVSSGAVPVGDPEHGRAFMSTQVSELALVSVDAAALQAQCAIAGLRDYQEVGVHHLVCRSAALLADDMGLGKSRQAVVASRFAAGSARVLVVCPASLRINWEREIRMVFPQAVVGMVGEDRMATLRGCDWVIANYERLGGLVRELELTFAVLTIDEAHMLKEADAGRTRNAFILAQRIPRRFLLTGTPLLSREIEMHTLLRLSGHALGVMTLKAFRSAYAGSSEKRALLAGELRHWMLRRRKDVLTDLGAKRHQIRYISPAEGLDAYQKIWADMSLMTMPKIVKLRQSLEALKTDFIIDTIGSLADEDKVIVFVEYMASVAAIQEACQTLGVGVVSLVGSDATAKRQKAVDAFQNDPQIKVFIGTTSAAGVGITLTAANVVVFASLPWTPALMRQAEDRAYRLGQKRDVLVLVPLIPKTIDEQIHQLLDNKTALEQDVVEAVRSHLSLAA